MQTGGSHRCKHKAHPVPHTGSRRKQSWTAQISQQAEGRVTCFILFVTCCKKVLCVASCEGLVEVLRSKEIRTRSLCAWHHHHHHHQQQQQPKWALPHFSAHSEHDEQNTTFQSTAAVRATIEANKRRSKEKKTVGVTLKHNEEERNARDQALTEQVGNRGRGNKTTMKHSESEASHACTTVCMGVCVCACVSNV